MIDHVQQTLWKAEGPAWLQLLANGLVPNTDTLRQIMQMIHATELEKYVYAKDPRVTYLPFAEWTHCGNIVDTYLRMSRLVTPDVETQLFGIDPVEPYDELIEYWKHSDNIAYSLGALALAIAYRLEDC